VFPQVGMLCETAGSRRFLFLGRGSLSIILILTTPFAFFALAFLLFALVLFGVALPLSALSRRVGAVALVAWASGHGSHSPCVEGFVGYFVDGFRGGHAASRHRRDS
jgi:hypothetical protein